MCCCNIFILTLSNQNFYFEQRLHQGNMVSRDVSVFNIAISTFAFLKKCNAVSPAPLFRFNLQFHGAESEPGWIHCSGLSSFSGALLLLSGRGRPQDLGTRGTTSSEGVKKSKLNGSDSLWKNSYRQLGGFDMASSPTTVGPVTPVPGTRTCRSEARFHRQRDYRGAWCGRPVVNEVLWKPPYAWKSLYSSAFVQHIFMGQHWPLWGFEIYMGLHRRV